MSYTRGPSQCSKSKNKRYKIGRERVKLPLFANTVVYTEDLRNNNKKILWELIRTFIKVAGYKVNIQKLYFSVPAKKTLGKWSLKIAVPVVSKYAAYLGICLIKDTKDLSKNYKTLMREILNDLNKWRDRSCLEVGIIKMVTVFILLKLIVDSMQSQNPQYHFMYKMITCF